MQLNSISQFDLGTPLQGIPHICQIGIVDFHFERSAGSLVYANGYLRSL